VHAMPMCDAVSRSHRNTEVAVDPRGSLWRLLRGRLRSNPCTREPYITQASIMLSGTTTLLL
jgi:hypothetical protein